MPVQRTERIRCYAKRGGRFTLFELVAVLAFLGILLSVAAPSLRGFYRGRGTVEEARRFLAMTRLARSEALSRGEIVEIWISGTENAYGLHPLGREDTAAYPFERRRLGAGTRVSVETGSATPEDPYSVLWFPDGFFTAPDLVCVSLHGTVADADVLTLVPEPAYGRFRTEREGVE